MISTVEPDAGAGAQRGATDLEGDLDVHGPWLRDDSQLCSSTGPSRRAPGGHDDEVRVGLGEKGGDRRGSVASRALADGHDTGSGGR